MEVVNKLPRPTDPAALQRLLDTQRILCSRCVGEEDCEQAQALLEELIRPVDAGGFGYFPALLTLASLHSTGFEPAIPQDEALAARQYIQLLTHEKAATELAVELLDDAAAQLCALVKDGRARLEEEEIGQLRELGCGRWSGSVGSVASWIGFARVEADRLLIESREDPEVREQRIAREKSREEARAKELARQHDFAHSALAQANELRQQGNDEYRQGHLPGNSKARLDLARSVEFYSKAIEVLSACLADLTFAVEDANEVRRQRGILHSNSAQVEIMVENWSEAAHHSRKAMLDDPKGLKPKYRLAKAQAGLKDWGASAKTVDDCLSQLAKEKKADTEDMTTELWKLADEISAELPTWKWSCEKPAPRGPSEDYERRLPGKWEYGPEGKTHTFEIRLTKMGQLIFEEGEVKIDLMRKSKLRWRGEYEMLSGMVVTAAYEPGSDVLIIEFTPPDDIPEDQKAKGHTKFTARRLTRPTPSPGTEPEPPMPSDSPEPQKEAEVAPVAAPEPLSDEATEKLPEGTPIELHFSGPPELAGIYRLLPEENFTGRHAVYQQQTDGTEHAMHFFWYRGGNWCITSSMNSSSLAAPSLARCPDATGEARHPLQVHRQRWFIRRGRGQEELDSTVTVQGANPGPKEAIGSLEATDAKRYDGNEGLQDTVPTVITVTGRTGRHADVNGEYKISSSTWLGRPVYKQVEPDIDKAPLSLFFNNNFWVLADEVCTLPRARARCRPDVPESAHPLHSGRAYWEFLRDEVQEGRMMTTVTSTYMVDRSVVLVAHGISAAGYPGATSGAVSGPDAVSPQVSSDTAGNHIDLFANSSDFNANILNGKGAVNSRSNASKQPAWVASSAVELIAGEIRASIAVSEAFDADPQSLSLDIAEDVLKVGLAGRGVLELRLPAAVDAAANPKAKWLEKTRTLRVRLAILAMTDGMD